MKPPKRHTCQSHSNPSQYQRQELKVLSYQRKVSLDYLVGDVVNSKFDKSTLKRIEEIQQLEEDKKKRLFDVIDTFIRESKGRKAFAH